MAERVFYHHPVDRQFSLDFVNPDAERVGERVAGYGPGTSVKVREYDLDRSVYVVYTNSGADGAAEEMDFDVADRVEALEDPNAVIAARYVRIFKNVLERNYEEAGERVQAYKNVDPEAIGRALEQTDWSGSAVDVAGRLASNLILKHPLPNANHRTAIGTIELYLSRLEPEFTIPATARELADEYAWMEWVDEYIEESKRLLTVRRKGDSSSTSLSGGVTSSNGSTASRSGSTTTNSTSHRVSAGHSTRENTNSSGFSSSRKLSRGPKSTGYGRLRVCPATSSSRNSRKWRERDSKTIGSVLEKRYSPADLVDLVASADVEPIFEFFELRFEAHRERI